MPDSTPRSSVPIARAPWKLRGRGVIFLYQFDVAVLDDPRALPESLRSQFVGGPGVVMWVQYEDSSVGPYDEVLLIPGQFQTSQGTYYSITNILVSSQASVVNGQANWGIPKRLADFEETRVDRRVRRLEASRDGRTFASWTVRGRGPKLPVTTAVVPAGMRTLAQTWGGKTFLTSPKARGWMRSAHLEGSVFEGPEFPDLEGQKLLGAFEVSSFRMEFPVPKVLGEALLPYDGAIDD